MNIYNCLENHRIPLKPSQTNYRSPTHKYSLVKYPDKKTTSSSHADYTSSQYAYATLLHSCGTRIILASENSSFVHQAFHGRPVWSRAFASSVLPSEHQFQILPCYASITWLIFPAPASKTSPSSSRIMSTQLPHLKKRRAPSSSYLWQITPPCLNLHAPAS